MKLGLVLAGCVVFGGVIGFLAWPRARESIAGGTGAGIDSTGTSADAAAKKLDPRPADRGESESVATKPEDPSVERVVDRGRASVTQRGIETQAISWPVRPARRSAGRRTQASTSSGTPKVAAKLAFRALYYVGVDPEAERTWLTAINDPNLPPGVRSDLIEDLNDEGYTDNSNPTKADLPLIRARLELIERLAPYAMDQVNADAFEEAYKDLLEMYIRLTRG